MIKIAKISIYLIYSLFSVGCISSGHKTVGGDKYSSSYDAFMNGAVRFDCWLGCSGTWGANKDVIVGLYKAGMYKDAANKILYIGYESMASYYLLGSIADDLGNHKAAVIYYDLSTKANPCGRTIDPDAEGCVQLNLPDALYKKMAKK